MLYRYFAQVAGPIWPTGFTRLCGVNSDQHFYVHINPEEQGDTIDIIINTVTRQGSYDNSDKQICSSMPTVSLFSRSRYKFGFWITQIDCSVDSNLEAPAGCTQFHQGDQVQFFPGNFFPNWSLKKNCVTRAQSRPSTSRASST